MFIYKEQEAIEVYVTRPDIHYFLLLDRQLNGCSSGLQQAQVYIRQAFMIHNQEFHNIAMQLGVNLLNDMEILAKFIHLMHGEDDRYYDESNDDTPVFEFIKPCDEKEELQEEKIHHVNNDLTAAILRDMQYEENRIELYEKLYEYIEDEGGKHIFSYLKQSAQKSMRILKNLMQILTTHTETKDFGLTQEHDAFDLDTSNYFDKPNPIFINPSDVNDFKEE